MSRAVLLTNVSGNRSRSEPEKGLGGAKVVTGSTMEDMKERCKELPEELNSSQSLIEFVINLLPNAYLFDVNRCEALCRALERFRELKEIELSHLGDLSDVNYPVLKIAYSGLDLQLLSFYRFPVSPSVRRLGSAMNNLKILRCSEFDSLRDLDHVHLTDALPRLEELDIRCNRFGPRGVWHTKLPDQFVTEAGIETTSRNLRGLHRIDISGNYFCSYLSLIALSSNCVLLKCRGCNIIGRGIDWVLSHSTNLTSLQEGFYVSLGNSAFPFDDMDISATGLRELGSGDQERLLCSIAKGGIPLEKLSLHGPRLYQRHELTTLLRAFPTLKHFKVRSGYSINGNNKTREICRCLPNIEDIELDGFYSLTATTFSVLAKECPALSEIKLRNGYMSLFEDDFVMNLERN
ncbi:uncharacterized protein LOC131298770 [Rhododendron vialii]|uniref:uncharacterized protein LOC131298770 n=1 Tax=Rhododendron vialii TaxID=182163 RepID=UPI00265D83E3|nr:uncharacterized protein LOC131298770 [Rhododendron vialii]